MASSASHTSRNFQLSKSFEICQRVIILPFGPPKFILSDDHLKFDCKAIQDFARDQKIQWKNIAIYNSRGSGMAERMVGTIKRALQKMCRENMADWDLRIDQVLHRYLRRSSTDSKSLFNVLYDVKSRL